MAKNAKARFVIPAEGRPRELFSLRRTSGGCFTLIVKPAGEHDSQPGRRILWHKFSIHHSAQSKDGGRLIKQAVAYTDSPDPDKGEPKTYQYKIPGPDGFLAVVYGMICPDLKGEHYLLKEGTKDEILEIVPYDAAWVTLFYFVVACHPPRRLEDFAPLGMNIQEFRGKGMQFIVLSAFFPVPPIPQGDILTPLTDKNIQKYMLGEQHITCESLPDILSQIASSRDMLKGKLRERIAAFPFSEGGQLPQGALVMLDDLLNQLGHIANPSELPALKHPASPADEPVSSE